MNSTGNPTATVRSGEELDWQALDEHLQTPYLRAFIAKAEELLAGALDVSIWKKIS